MSKIIFVPASIDTETTGLNEGIHDIVQLAITLHDQDFKPTGLRFTSYIKPQRPYSATREAFGVNGIDISKIDSNLNPVLVRSSFLAWKEDLFGDECKFYPMGHNFSFDRGFLRLFFTPDLYSRHFHYHFRDTQQLAISLRDVGRLEVSSVSLSSLADHFKIPRSEKHDAYEDSLVTLKIYKELLNLIR